MAIQTANTTQFFSNSSTLTSLGETTIIKLVKTFVYYSGDVKFTSGKQAKKFNWR